MRAGFHISRILSGLFFVCLLFLNDAVKGEEQGNDLLVFAAASLKDALEPIGADFERETGARVRFSFAATSALARQIAAGAPADLFISADLEWMDWLTEGGYVSIAEQKMIARNRLALAAPAFSPLSDDLSVLDHLKNWKNQENSRLAVADPGHVPAGRYAQAALKGLERQLGAYDTLFKRFVLTENVRLAGLLVARGEVPLAIIYRSDALIDPRIKLLGLFDADSHRDILYPAALTRNAATNAKVFLNYLGKQSAQAHLIAAGLAAAPQLRQ